MTTTRRWLVRVSARRLLLLSLSLSLAGLVLLAPRPALADSFDTAADRVLGQANFTTNLENYRGTGGQASPYRFRRPRGAAQVLASDTVSLDLAQSGFQASGPDDPTVKVTFSLQFSGALAGRGGNIELFATDDDGTMQGPDLAGTWSVGPRPHLPLVAS